MGRKHGGSITLSTLFWPLFLFLAATIVAVFTFTSIAHWVGTQSQERQARDRYALLKALAEMPGDNARRILDLMVEQDQRRARKARAERMMGGLVTFAVGASLSLMLAMLAHEERGVWTVGLIPASIGAVIFVFNLLTKAETGPASSPNGSG